MLGTLLEALVMTVVLAAPTAAVTLAWNPRSTEGEDAVEAALRRSAFGLFWGLGFVPMFAFVWALFFDVQLTRVTTIVSALLVTVGGLVVWRWRSDQESNEAAHRLRDGFAHGLPVVLACLAVWCLYLVRYDASVYQTIGCITRTVTAVTGGDGHDVLWNNLEDQRLGNTAVLTSFVVLYGGLGHRVAFACLGLFMALGGYLLGRRALGSHRWGVVTMLVLTLNPYVLSLPVVDENLIFLGYSCLFLPLLLRANTPWLSAGAMFGMLFMIRHIAVLCAPAVLWALWRHRGSRLRAAIGAFVTYNAVAAIGYIHHTLANGSPMRLETWEQLDPVRHRFIGEYPGLLQWPFAEAIVRTPWNPFPTLLMWPTYLIDRLGLVLAAAVLVGAVSLVRRRLDEGLFWLLWLGFAYAGLSLQENWDYPNKMGIILIVFVPFAVWAAAGLKAVRERPARVGVALLLTIAALWSAMIGLGNYDAPIDERYVENYEGLRAEDPAYVDIERERITSVALWPDYSHLARPAPFSFGHLLGGLVDALRDPSAVLAGPIYGLRARDELSPDAESVEIEIDLSRRLVGSDRDWVRVATDDAAGHIEAPELRGVEGRDYNRDGSPDAVWVDLTADGPSRGEAVVLQNMHLAWSPEPVTIVLTGRGAPITGVMLLFGDLELNEERFERIPENLGLYSGLEVPLFDEITEVTREERAETITRLDGVGDRLFLRVPAGVVSITDSLNEVADRLYVWRARVDADGVELPTFIEPTHN